MQIESAHRDDYSRLIDVWEASVRATHDFLTEPDIEALRPLILEQYFDAVTLDCIRDSHGEIQGFSGTAGDQLEMLFIAPTHRGSGLGRALCQHAVDRRLVTRVDVNEHNPQAIGFYQRLGFEVVGRSPVDGQGRPFPLLHMALTTTH
ncbi:GNAT family N-acetyltransferase [Marinobacter xestospongiae]|uniref:GNAT family N-acetyltransferase n=1 Tax=Marinobacter xestospongiae TaxID=994319 RepID=A0ABU3VZ31_9GAMM|nr:GNAT family N-acetyltransferase [Marinobacter xestospongiae]MDV2079540.1 GNAT family N-acetyltransferase [Marinobacter xestospongiae]